MSISIYYRARRATRLTNDEIATISRLEDKYAVETHIEAYNQTGEGYNWESFCIYDPNDPTEPDVVFEDATKRPDNSEDAVWDGLQHWCKALTEIRQVLADAAWEVHVDDHEIPWVEAANEYDPSK